MKKMLLTACVCLGLAAHASAQGPMQPTSEHQALGVWVGDWVMKADMKDSPMGPGGPMTADEKCEWFSGMFVICRSTGTSPMGPMEGMAIFGWDATKQKYTYYSINSMGMSDSATGTKTGDTWVWTNEMDMGGQTMHSRFTMAPTSAGVYSMKWEMGPTKDQMMTMMTGTTSKKK